MLGAELPGEPIDGEEIGLSSTSIGADQRCAVLEIVRAIHRPELKFLVMRSDSVQMLLPLAGCRRFAG